MSPNEPIADPEQATAQWVTGALRRSGRLASGEVLEVERSAPRKTTTATVCHLSLKYSTDAPDSVPRTLFLKVSRPDSPFQQTQQEFQYYTSVARAMAEPLSVCCYDSAIVIVLMTSPFSSFFRTSIPSVNWPNTECLPSR